MSEKHLTTDLGDCSWSRRRSLSFGRLRIGRCRGRARRLATEPVGCNLFAIAGTLEKIKQWLRGSKVVTEEDAEGGRPVATQPAAASDRPERETSTNAQTAGASDEPWPGND